MARLYLHCSICSRKQAEGLLSGAAWGRLELPADAEIAHPELRGAKLRVCPSCMQRHPDWEQSLLESFGLGGSPPLRAEAQ